MTTRSGVPVQAYGAFDDALIGPDGTAEPPPAPFASVRFDDPLGVLSDEPSVVAVAAPVAVAAAAPVPAPVQVLEPAPVGRTPAPPPPVVAPTVVAARPAAVPARAVPNVIMPAQRPRTAPPLPSARPRSTQPVPSARPRTAQPVPSARPRTASQPRRSGGASAFVVLLVMGVIFLATSGAGRELLDVVMDFLNQ